MLRKRQLTVPDVLATWKGWGKKEVPEGWSVYAVLVPTNDKWVVALWVRKISGGPLYKLENQWGVNRLRRRICQSRLLR